MVSKWKSERGRGIKEGSIYLAASGTCCSHVTLRNKRRARRARRRRSRRRGAGGAGHAEETQETQQHLLVADTFNLCSTYTCLNLCFHKSYPLTLSLYSLPLPSHLVSTVYLFIFIHLTTFTYLTGPKATCAKHPWCARIGTTHACLTGTPLTYHVLLYVSFSLEVQKNIIL